jgi:hypothetical protein
VSTTAATFASKSKRAEGLGDTRPTFRRLGVIAGKLRRDLTLPSCARLGVELECSYKTIQRDIDLLRDFFQVPAGIRRQQVPVQAGRAAAEGGAVSLADLLVMFSARIVARYTPEQYAQQVIIARNNRMRWGIGQW